MLERTRRLWAKQHAAVGDRRGLFGTVAEFRELDTVLYAGSYVDITPSLIWPTVTYVDTDRRAAQFFGDAEGVAELLDELGAPTPRQVEFLHADYTVELDLDDESFDLLVSMYAGPVSHHCGRYVRPGGLLFVNPSHGDTALASIDPRFELVGAVVSQSGGYRLRTDGLDRYLVPKREVDLTVDGILASGRGIAYTKPAFAYLFERIA